MLIYIGVFLQTPKIIYRMVMTLNSLAKYLPVLNLTELVNVIHIIE